LSQRGRQALARLKPLGTGSAARLKLAKAYFDAERYQEAEDEVRDVLETEPELHHAHFLLAEIAASQGKDEHAITEFQTATRINPRFVDAHRRLGDLYLQHQRYEEAKAAYRTTLRLDPKLTIARVMLGAVYFETRGYKQAIEEYQKAVRNEPELGKGGHTIADYYTFIKTLTPEPRKP
jgi:Tfp pilus assembly protein PilF